MINNQRKSKAVSMKVHPKFYERIEKERREFMQKNNLTKLSTVAFTGVLGKGVINNGKKKTRTKK